MILTHDRFHFSHKAARGGHLEVLKWARSQGCPWDASTCAYAARGPFGSVEMGTKPGLSLGRVDMCLCCSWRPFGSVEMVEKPRLSLE